MNAVLLDERHPRVQAALAELRGMISAVHPTAEFTVSRGDDPEGIYLTATVDVDDTDEVVDLFIERLLDMQIDEGLQIYVVPVEPLERVLARMHTTDGDTSARPSALVAVG